MTPRERASRPTYQPGDNTGDVHDNAALLRPDLIRDDRDDLTDSRDIRDDLTDSRDDRDDLTDSRDDRDDLSDSRDDRDDQPESRTAVPARPATRNPRSPGDSHTAARLKPCRIHPPLSPGITPPPSLLNATARFGV